MNRELVEFQKLNYNYNIKNATKNSRLSKLEGQPCFILATDITEKSVADLRKLLKTTNYRIPFGIFGYIHIQDNNFIVYKDNKVFLNIPTGSVFGCSISYATEILMENERRVGKLYIFKFKYDDKFLSDTLHKMYEGKKYVVIMTK